MMLHVLRWSHALVLGTGVAGVPTSVAHAGHPGWLVAS